MKFLILIAISFSSFAAVPPVEGLFRNSNNKLIEEDFVSISMLIEIDKAIVDTEVKEVSLETAEMPLEETAVEPTPIYIKFVLKRNQRGQIRLVRLRYDKGLMNLSSIVKIDVIKDLTKEVERSSSYEKGSFYSLISMFGFNRSDEFRVLFQKFGKEHKSNKELMDAEKLRLFSRYKRYLKKKKEESILETDINPLKPEDEEAQEKVKSTMKSRMYKLPNNVSLQLRGSKFHWAVDLGEIQATFDNKSHRIDELKYKGGEVKYRFGGHVLFNGEHEIPKDIIVSKTVADEEKNIRIRVLDFRTLNLNDQKYSKLMTKYKDALKENLKSNIEPKDIIIPIFLE